MEVSVEVDGETSICFHGSFHLLPWKLPSASMEASICFHLVAPTSMEVGGSFHPWELVEASMEVDGNFHGRTLKNQIM